MAFARNAWFCAAFSTEVDASLLGRKILGDGVLITPDSAGVVRAIGDRCPHRFAPLHRGVRDDDDVARPYHGSRSDRGGRCVLDPHYDANETSVRIDTLMRDVPTPSSQPFHFDPSRGDYQSDIEWVCSGTLCQRLALTESGADADAGAVTRNVHLIAPETETSTDCSWIHSRNRLMDYGPKDERTRAILNNAFRTEEEAMMQACQESRIMKRSIAEEATETARHSVTPAKAASVRAIPA